MDVGKIPFHADRASSARVGNIFPSVRVLREWVVEMLKSGILDVSASAQIAARHELMVHVGT